MSEQVTNREMFSFSSTLASDKSEAKDLAQNGVLLTTFGRSGLEKLLGGQIWHAFVIGLVRNSLHSMFVCNRVNKA